MAPPDLPPPTFTKGLQESLTRDEILFKRHLAHSQGPSLQHEFLLIPTNILPTNWTILIKTNLPN